MKLLHTADLHIGKTFNGVSLLEDQRAIFEQILVLAAEEGIDALILAGDIYDKFSPSAEAVRLFSWFLTQAVDAGLHVIATPGNHDSAERIGYASDLLERRNVHLAGPYEGAIKKVTLPAPEDLSDKAKGRIPVVLWLFPFVKPVHVRPYFPEAEIGTDYTAALAQMVGSCELDPEAVNIAVVHQFLLGGAPLSSGAGPSQGAPDVQVGGLDAVDPRVFAGFDYVAAGHIHRPQTVAVLSGEEPACNGPDAGTVRYAGSPLKYSFSETTVAKSVTIIEVDDQGSLTLSERQLEPLHDVRRIRGPLEELCSKEVVGASQADDYLEVTLTDESVPLGALAKLRRAYPHILALRHEPERRSADQEGASWARHPHDMQEESTSQEGLSPFEVFAQFYEQQTGVPLNADQKKIADRSLAAALEGAATGDRAPEEEAL